MPEYLAPGVYVEEIERGPRPIEGVPTGTAAFIGETERGPTTPRLVTSEADYRRWFGGSFGGGDRYMPHAVQGFFANGGRRLHVCRVVGADAATASMSSGDFSVRAIGAGAWGNRVWVALSDSVQAAAGTASPRFRLQAAYWSSAPDGFEPLDPFARANKNRQSAPTLMEEFDGLSIDEASPDHFRRRLDGISTLVTLDGPPGSEPARSTGALLGAGADAADGAGVDDFIGEPTATRTEAQGLAALGSDACRDVALVHAPRPARDALAIARELIAHCEQHRFRFAVIDGARGESHIAALDPRATLADSSFAAFYHPWLQATDPASGAPVLVPPGGHVLGIYARIDTERGVFKTPANEVVRGIVDLEFSIGREAQELLSPRSVNLIRGFEGRGIRVWGSRTLSSDPEWKYVPIRRLFIFIERSIQQGTQWAVFEPNDDRLWTRLSDAVRLFLRTQWRAGALLGATEEQAFSVRCDRTTMTQNDMDNGRLVCEVGIAPLRPAEFVIFRIVQQTADAQR